MDVSGELKCLVFKTVMSSGQDLACIPKNTNLYKYNDIKLYLRHSTETVACSYLLSSKQIAWLAFMNPVARNHGL